MDRDSFSIQSIIGIIFVVALIVAVPGIVTMMNDTIDNQPTQKSDVEAASYIIYKDGDDTCAKNGSTGRIDYRNTNASSVIQAAIDRSNSAFISKGEYTITYPIYLKNETVIDGAGFNLARLKLSMPDTLIHDCNTTWTAGSASIILDAVNTTYDVDTSNRLEWSNVPVGDVLAEITINKNVLGSRLLMWVRANETISAGSLTLDIDGTEYSVPKIVGPPVTSNYGGISPWTRIGIDVQGVANVGTLKLISNNATLDRVLNIEDVVVRNYGIIITPETASYVESPSIHNIELMGVGGGVYMHGVKLAILENVYVHLSGDGIVISGGTGGSWYNDFNSVKVYACEVGVSVEGETALSNNVQWVGGSINGNVIGLQIQSGNGHTFQAVNFESSYYMEVVNAGRIDTFGCRFENTGKYSLFNADESSFGRYGGRRTGSWACGDLDGFLSTENSYISASKIGNTYYVTASSNYQEVVNEAVYGSTIVFAPGTYGKLDLKNKQGLTIVGGGWYGTEATIFNGGISSVAIDISNTYEVRLENIVAKTTKGGGQTFAAIYCYGYMFYCSMDKVWVSESDDIGINIGVTTDSVLVTNNVFTNIRVTNTDSYGIYLSGSTDAVGPKHSTFSGVFTSGTGEAGIHVRRGNNLTFSNIDIQPPSSGNFNGFNIATAAKDVRISNIISRGVGSGIPISDLGTRTVIDGVGINGENDPASAGVWFGFAYEGLMLKWNSGATHYMSVYRGGAWYDWVVA